MISIRLIRRVERCQKTLSTMRGNSPIEFMSLKHLNYCLMKGREMRPHRLRDFYYERLINRLMERSVWQTRFSNFLGFINVIAFVILSILLLNERKQANILASFLSTTKASIWHPPVEEQTYVKLCEQDDGDYHFLIEEADFYMIINEGLTPISIYNIQTNIFGYDVHHSIFVRSRVDFFGTLENYLEWTQKGIYPGLEYSYFTPSSFPLENYTYSGPPNLFIPARGALPLRLKFITTAFISPDIQIYEALDILSEFKLTEDLRFDLSDGTDLQSDEFMGRRSDSNVDNYFYWDTSYPIVKCGY